MNPQRSQSIRELLEDVDIVDADFESALGALAAAADQPAPTPRGALAEVLAGRMSPHDAVADQSSTSTVTGGTASDVVALAEHRARKRRNRGITGGATVIALAAAASLAGVAAADDVPRASAPVVSVQVDATEDVDPVERPDLEVTAPPAADVERTVERAPINAAAPEPSRAAETPPAVEETPEAPPTAPPTAPAEVSTPQPRPAQDRKAVLINPEAPGKSKPAKVTVKPGLRGEKGHQKDRPAWAGQPGKPPHAGSGGRGPSHRSADR
ncbi:hypothetical protein [Zhihengliuella flava]|uniref:Uncharacterized protein n=1 Tax=Zhihengliuella flava TaxID=1285193 RepID=A0A931GJ47_9MICC|nr:hypothetical protein [Zhihengliuella flava]MBG6084951.1 hypothetical protein [Zhihengliuella flava]